jgi:hypothetical protein
MVPHAGHQVFTRAAGQCLFDPKRRRSWNAFADAWRAALASISASALLTEIAVGLTIAAHPSCSGSLMGQTQGIALCASALAMASSHTSLSLCGTCQRSAGRCRGVHRHYLVGRRAWLGTAASRFKASECAHPGCSEGMAYLGRILLNLYTTAWHGLARPGTCHSGPSNWNETSFIPSHTVIANMVSMASGMMRIRGSQVSTPALRDASRAHGSISPVAYPALVLLDVRPCS